MEDNNFHVSEWKTHARYTIDDDSNNLKQKLHVYVHMRSPITNIGYTYLLKHFTTKFDPNILFLLKI